VRIHLLEREQWIPRPLKKVFPFFERPENLALITPPWMGFELLSPSPVAMAEGRLIDYRIRIKGMPVRWCSLISSYEPPHRFVDKQVIGPYAYWSHLHRFRSHGNKTCILDRVRYALPRWLVGPAGRAVHGGFVRPALEEIFDFRAAVFERLYGATTHGSVHGGNNP